MLYYYAKTRELVKVGYSNKLEDFFRIFLKEVQWFSVIVKTRLLGEI